MPIITDETVLSLARGAAFSSRADHSYLPQTTEERDAFVPHDWVLKAIRQVQAWAYEQGRQDQRNDAQRQQ